MGGLASGERKNENLLVCIGVNVPLCKIEVDYVNKCICKLFKMTRIDNIWEFYLIGSSSTHLWVILGDLIQFTEHCKWILFILIYFMIWEQKSIV